MAKIQQQQRERTRRGAVERSGTSPSARLEAAQGGKGDTQSDGILCREVLCRRERPGDKILVFRHETGMVIGGRIIRTQACLTREHNNIAAWAVAVEVERDAGMLLQVLMAFGTRLAIDQDRRSYRVPEEPHRIGLWCAFAIYRREPENTIIVKPTRDLLSKPSSL